MKKLISGFLVGFSFLFFSGCAAVGDFVDNNPVVVNIIVQEAVVRYIDKGSTFEQKKERADQARNVLEKTKSAVEAGSVAKVGELILFANSQINYDKMSVSDKLLVTDIFYIINAKFNSEQDLVNPETVVRVKTLINTAIDATKLF